MSPLLLKKTEKLNDNFDYLTSVNGQWNAWEGWEACTKSCGGGIQKRVRRCGNPAPANGGRDCIGAREQTAFCNQQACPSKYSVLSLLVVG